MVENVEKCLKTVEKVSEKCPFFDEFLADYAHDLRYHFLGPGKSLFFLKITENGENHGF